MGKKQKSAKKEHTSEQSSKNKEKEVDAPGDHAECFLML